MHLDVRRISPDELDTFCAILSEAAAWLAQAGMPMWTAEQVSPAGVWAEYHDAELFLGFVDGVAAATIIVQEEDPVFWPEAAPGTSLFVHKLSVRRAYAKQGVSQAMLAWAGEEAIRRGKAYLRLDCAAERSKLRTFYESLGFVLVREQVMFGQYPTAFYERRLITPRLKS
ncbi:GNAT family N-acetyltransferase [Alicyclobacillus cellulosilyticus]|uniref:GNAT family N-acetyltransferase n=1 Tax=Alicyclobacillus cellulosilyticus TaxID=1003997 RepID=A0A917K6B5_9BACL|nr:GNAT family N-acetyltransferase [Alicyclobacillus cellulosilyticus]GGJ02658.1 GNAT family N-acetyltransferase [Alicyclobacillus cellulosilyticus]